MYNRHEGQESMRIALEGISSYYEEYSFPERPRQAWEAFATAHGNFDVIFLHVQAPNVIPLATAKLLHSLGVKIYNFTGDVRQPLPKWYIDLAPYVTTLFTNMHDVNTLRSMGFDAHYFQVGYNEHYYNNDVVAAKNVASIVFMGNNYGKTFPLGDFRKDLVATLTRKYRNDFAVYGCGWGGNTQNINNNQTLEGQIYRGCKIAINLSHFNLSRYSSDRLFRILGCEAFCLSHKYLDIDMEFEDGKDLVTWSSLAELVHNIDKYLPLEEERRQIAKQGNITCTTNFTWTVRMNQLKELWEAVALS